MLTPESCPFRDGVANEKGSHSARCDLVAQITRIRDETFFEVRRDACEACCRLTPSTMTQINPVIASHLYGIASAVIERGGVPGCDLGKAVGIRSWAYRNLQWVGGEEPVDYVSHLRRRLSETCRHLGAPKNAETAAKGEEGIFECRHPDHVEASPSRCHLCREWTDGHDEESDLLGSLVHPRSAMQPREDGREVRSWAVGVTTSPRAQPTLEWCLDCLIRAGWEDPHLFADSEVAVAERHRHLRVSERRPRLGAWPSYYLALAELLMRKPHADAYLVVQDDALLYDRECVREHLEGLLWPGDDTGAVSLYCSTAYTRDEPGWYEYEDAWVWGAVAFVFPREAAKRFVADPCVLEHRWSKRHDGCANIDVVIGKWAQRQGLKIYFPTPSLAQHIGDVSTLWANGRAIGARRAVRFAGDRPPPP